MSFIGGESIVRQAVSLFFFGHNGGVAPVIADIQLEVLTNESIELSNDVPSYPTEKGFNVNDSITNSDERLSISGVIANASIQPITSSIASSLVAGRWSMDAVGINKLAAAKAALEDLCRERTLVTVTTALGTYVDYAIDRLNITRDGFGSQLNIDIELKKIIIAETEEVDVPEVVAQSEGTKGTGANGKAGESRKDGGQAKTSEPSQSAKEWLSELFKSGGKIWSLLF